MPSGGVVPPSSRDLAVKRIDDVEYVVVFTAPEDEKTRGVWTLYMQKGEDRSSSVVSAILFERLPGSRNPYLEAELSVDWEVLQWFMQVVQADMVDPGHLSMTEGPTFWEELEG